MKRGGFKTYPAPDLNKPVVEQVPVIQFYDGHGNYLGCCRDEKAVIPVTEPRVDEIPFRRTRLARLRDWLRS